MRLFPAPVGRKQAGLATALAAALAGCGGGDDAVPRTVDADRYRFEAPQDWRVKREGRTVTAVAPGDDAAVSVTEFRLARSYRARLWPRVQRELDRVAEALARRLGGAVEARETLRTRTRPLRSYRFSGARDDTRRIGFALAGRREYQLLCRWSHDEPDDEACERLFASFRLARG